MSNRHIIIPNSILFSNVRELLSNNKEVTITVKGNSMLPFIKGDIDKVTLKKELSYSKGDIVLAEINKDIYVLHRIISINDNDIILMGDGNLKGMVEECKIENIQGKVIKIIKANKEIDCNNKQNRSLAQLWFSLLPIRRYLLGIYRRVM